MTAVEIYMYCFCIFMGGLVFVSYRRKWSWYMDNYQSRPWREIMGESGFGLFSYALSAVLIGLGSYKLLLGAGLL